MNILEKITERTKERIEEEKKIVPLEEVRRQAEEKGIKDQIPAFEQALRADGLSFICEAKKASPSKGLIAPDFPYVEIARDYEAGGAAAISCLTEPFWFRGSDEYLKEIVQNVSTPEQAAKMCQSADGAIVGSAIVKLCEKYGKDCVPYVAEYVKSMVEACK